MKKVTVNARAPRSSNGREGSAARWVITGVRPRRPRPAHGFGLIKNHPFIDGNKRIGFVTADLFLLLNGHEIEAPEPQVVDITLRVADGSLSEAECATWIRSVLVSYDP